MLPRKFYFSDVFDDLLEGENSKMKCDIYESDGIYNIEIDMPGYTKEDISIECNKGTIVISANKENKEEDTTKNYIKRERFYGSVSRSFYLGEVDEENIKAEFKDGTLIITVPKIDENSNKKVITID